MGKEEGRAAGRPAAKGYPAPDTGPVASRACPGLLQHGCRVQRGHSRSRGSAELSYGEVQKENPHRTAHLFSQAHWLGGQPWESAHGGAERKRSPREPGGEAGEVEGGPGECRGQEEQMEEQPCSAVRLQNRAKERPRFRSAGSGRKEVPGDLGENRAVAWEPDCRGLSGAWVERKQRHRV